MKVLTLPKKRDDSRSFRQRWAEHLTEAQLDSMVATLSACLTDVSEVRLHVSMRGGQIVVIDFPNP